MTVMAHSSGRRVFFVGVNTGYVSGCDPDERYLEFYRRRSSNQLYCGIVGNVAVVNGVGSNSSTPAISEASVWTRLAREMARGGTRPGIQLATAWKGYAGTRSFRAPEWRATIGRGRELVSSISSADRRAVLDSFDASAEIAAAHGFTHIQVHAAHGYLLSLLLDRRIAQTAEETLCHLSDLAAGWRSDGLETSIRFSLRTGDAEFDKHGAHQFQSDVVNLPFDYVDVSSGFYNIDKQLIYPGRPDVLLSRRRETIELALRNPERRFIYSGRALNFPTEDLPGNVDIGLCRDLLADPDFLMGGRVGCQNHGKCHYFSRGETSVTCPR